MTLENLARIGRLHAHSPTREEITKLLAAARRSLKDAHVEGLSAETRFDLAYKAIMQCALAALMANGFRPATSEPGHHATVIQSLSKTIELANNRCIVLEKFRRMRNLSDYSGDGISEEEAASCIRAGEGLLAIVREWLRDHRAELIA